MKKTKDPNLRNIYPTNGAWQVSVTRAKISANPIYGGLWTDIDDAIRERDKLEALYPRAKVGRKRGPAIVQPGRRLPAGAQPPTPTEDEI